MFRATEKVQILFEVIQQASQLTGRSLEGEFFKPRKIVCIT